MLGPGRWFKIIEGRTGATRASFEELIHFMATDDSCGQRMRTVRLSDGDLALLIDSDGGIRVSLQSGRITPSCPRPRKA